MATVTCPNCKGTGVQPNTDPPLPCMTTGCNGGTITVDDDWN